MAKVSHSVLTLGDLERRATVLEKQSDFDPEYAHALGKAIHHIRMGEWDGAIPIENGFKPFHRSKS